jgi:class 3 adenylate cyclase
MHERLQAIFDGTSNCIVEHGRDRRRAGACPFVTGDVVNVAARLEQAAPRTTS